MSDRGHVHDVGVRRVTDDPADVAGVAEARRLPRTPAVERPVDAVAPGRALTVVRFAGADPDDVGIRRRDRDVADRHHRVDAIEDRRPRGALVGALEDAAARGGDVNRVGPSRHARDGEVVYAAAGVRRADAAPREIAEQRGVHGRRALRITAQERAAGDRKKKRNGQQKAVTHQAEVYDRPLNSQVSPLKSQLKSQR